jgi:hypothetical protein
MFKVNSYKDIENFVESVLADRQADEILIDNISFTARIEGTTVLLLNKNNIKGRTSIHTFNKKITKINIETKSRSIEYIINTAKNDTSGNRSVTMYDIVLKDGRIRIDINAVKLNTDKNYKRLVKDMLL